MLCATLVFPVAANATPNNDTETSEAVAQDDSSDDDLDDILREDPEDEGSVKDEKDAVRDGDVDDTVGKKSSSVLTENAEKRRKRPIKVLQRKKFLKVGRTETGIHLGFVTNDPFINRYLIGASFGYHFTEVFGIEVTGTFSPNFGDKDWKPITRQLINNNKVSPDISKISWAASANFQFSPIYGKIALDLSTVNFDVFGVFGMGVTGTVDDLVALGKEGDPQSVDTEKQVHPTTNLGGGFRVIFSNNFAIRVEGRSLIYIETISSTTLEMKNNFLLLGSATFFLGKSS
jgi:outer membrane beta-barrel protein